MHLPASYPSPALPVPGPVPRLLPAQFRRIQPWRAMAALAFDWLLIGACFAAAFAWPHPPVLLGAAILIARTQLALAVLMHEAAHGLLARPRWLNDCVGQWCTAAPLVLSLPSYRHGHLEHHRAPMAATDPVATVFEIADYPVCRAMLAWRLVKDLTSIGYWLTVRDAARGRFRHLSKPTLGRAARAQVIGSIITVNGAMLGALWWAGRPELYLLLWTLPSLTCLQLFARVRALTEHAGYRFSEDQTRNARTIVAPSWQTFFCGPHAIHYHIEHHAHAGVPFYHLQHVHRFMLAAGELPASNLHRGYGSVLRDVTTPSATV